MHDVVIKLTFLLLRTVLIQPCLLIENTLEELLLEEEVAKRKLLVHERRFALWAERSLAANPR